jgi:hypothetical protein
MDVRDPPRRAQLCRDQRDLVEQRREVALDGGIGALALSPHPVLSLALAGMTPEIVLKYSGPVPRYTSYPTAPHFCATVAADTIQDRRARTMM